MFGTVTKITEYNTGLSFLITLGIVLIIIAVIIIMSIPKELKISIMTAVAACAILVFAGFFIMSKGVNESETKLKQHQEEISQAYQDSYKNIEKAIHDNFPEADILSDISESGSFKYKDDFYTYKVEDNTLYIECYSGDSSKNKIISGKDYWLLITDYYL